jgi:hypothetical protein
MPEPRGRQGHVRGLQPARAQELLAGAVHAIRDEEEAALRANAMDENAGEFTRAGLRQHFLEQGVTEEQADALVFAFWRAIPPLSRGYGAFALPENAEDMAAHRNWRLTSGRLQLADVLALRQMFERAAKEGQELTPGLAEFQRRSAAALKGLKVKPQRRRKV